MPSFHSSRGRHAAQTDRRSDVLFSVLIRRQKEPVEACEGDLAAGVRSGLKSRAQGRPGEEAALRTSTEEVAELVTAATP